MKIEWKSCLKVGVSVFLLYLCIRYWGALAGLFNSIIGAAFPLIIGGVIAYLINILMEFFERHYFPKSKKKFVKKSRRAVCLVAAIVSMLAIIALVIGLVLPQLWDAIMLILSEVPAFMKEAIAFVEDLNILPDNIFDMLEKIDWKSQISKIVSALTTGVGSVVDVAFRTVTTLFSGIVTALLAIIFSLYLLFGKDKLGYQGKRLLKHYMKPSWYEKFMYGITVFDDCFHRFIVGQCLEAVILGGLCTIGMLIFRFPYATMIGALVAFTALIPVAGAYIGAGVGAFMILTVSPFKALMFLIFIVVLQQLEGNLIYPRVVGSSIGLPGIWVLAAVTVGGGIFGIAGMLVGVPLVAAIYRIIREDMQNHRKPDDLPDEEELPEEEPEITEESHEDTTQEEAENSEITEES